MYLTELALEIEQALLDSDPSSWPGNDVLDHYVVPDDVPVKFALDPFSDSGILQPSIYVIPGFIQYRVDRSRRPNQQRHLKFVTVALCVRIKETDSEGLDVASREEVIKLLNLKEDLEKFLLDLNIGVQLEEVESDLPDEVQLKDRYYLATIVLGYATC